MPILWFGVERSVKAPAPRLSLRKRLRVIAAALTQEWHEKTCAECGGKWMAVGPHTELIAICDNCELNEMERFTAEMNKRYEQEMREAS